MAADLHHALHNRVLNAYIYISSTVTNMHDCICSLKIYQSSGDKEICLI